MIESVKARLDFLGDVIDAVIVPVIGLAVMFLLVNLAEMVGATSDPFLKSGGRWFEWTVVACLFAKDLYLAVQIWRINHQSTDALRAELVEERRRRRAAEFEITRLRAELFAERDRTDQYRQAAYGMSTTTVAELDGRLS